MSALDRRMKPFKELTCIPHKRGRRTYGNLFVWPDGRRAYIGLRRIKHAYRGGTDDIAKAARDGIAAWTFDTDTVLWARHKGAQAIGVFVRETGDCYLTSMKAITRQGLGLLDRTCPSGSGHKRIPFQHFKVKRGRLRL